MANNDDLWGSSERYLRSGYAGGTGRQFGMMARSPAEALEPDHAPEPPRGSRKRQQHPIFVFLNTFMTLLLVGVIGLAGLFYFVRTQFDKPGPLQHPTVIVIPEGEGAITIANRLEREGIISDKRIFMAGVLYFKARKKLKAGEYAIPKQASIRGVLDTLVEGRAVLYSISIPEGLTSEQIVERLRASEDLVGEVSAIPPEGSLLPDTYKVARGTTRDDLLKRMQTEQKKFLDKIWDQRARDLPFKTREEAIILASIVEKETARADERQRVAAVFVNRLRKKMRLESDPTIIYGIAGGKGTLGRPIYRSDIEQVTPYNTYRINGLPPTPIANPGRAAIEAVLKPSTTSELFFVADGTGGHAFAETYPEHLKNVAKWREIERQRAAAAAEAAKTQKTGAAFEPVAAAATAKLEEASSVPGARPQPAPAPAVPGFAVSPAAVASPKMADMPLPERRPAQ